MTDSNSDNQQTTPVFTPPSESVAQPIQSTSQSDENTSIQQPIRVKPPRLLTNSEDSPRIIRKDNSD